MLTDKFQVARVLREIALFLQLQGENPFKARAYDVVADRVMGLGEDLGDLVSHRRLREIPGVGEALEALLDELVRTGKSFQHERLLERHGQGALEMMAIPELGPKKVARIRELGIQDVAALERACQEGTLAHLRGFGPKSTEKILANIARMKRSGGKHRLGTVLPVAEQLVATVRQTPGVSGAEVAGGVRRRCETVSEVEIVASAKEPRAVLGAFASLAEDDGGDAAGRTSVRLRTGDIQVLVRVSAEDDFITALHQFTGAKGHLVKLRALAAQKGLSLSEHGLMRIRTAEKVPLADEAALYRELGLPFIPPELREDLGEIEAALAGRLPELLEASDVQGVVHSHSTWSDGRASLEEMARAARERGYRYLTVTDHSQAAHYAGGLEVDELRRQWDEVDALNERLEGITLLKGIEADILEDGALDYGDDVLEQLDVVIGSVHQRFKQDEAAMTRRVLAALDNPHLHILGHLTGRLIHKRDPYGLRIEEVMDKAAARGVAIEVNGNPERLDIHSDYVRMAVERGVKLTVSADSHSPRELANIGYAVAVARKGWAAREQVLNTLGPREFTAALRRHA